LKKTFQATIDQFKVLGARGEKIADKLLMANPAYGAMKGKNAAYVFNMSTAIVPDKMATAQFHELGHAMNANSKWGKLLLNLRKDYTPNALKISGIKIPFVRAAMGFVISSIALVGIFKNKKAEGEQAVGFWDKTTTFIKNNVGKLTFITMLPLVAEEALASFKGEKAVKGLINADLFKKVKLSNRLGLATYAVIAAFAGLGAMCATKIRDKIAQPNLNKA